MYEYVYICLWLFWPIAIDMHGKMCIRIEHYNFPVGVMDLMVKLKCFSMSRAIFKPTACKHFSIKRSNGISLSFIYSSCCVVTRPC